MVHDLQNKLDAAQIHTDSEVEGLVQAYVMEFGQFRKDLGSFVRAYDFLSQLYNYSDTDLEKRSVYFRHLLGVLRVNDARIELDLSDVVLAKYALKDLGKSTLKLSGDGDPLKPLIDVGTGQATDPVQATWREIIQQANLPLDGEEMGTIAHFLDGVNRELVKNPTLQTQARNNSEQHFSASPDLIRAITLAVTAAMDSHTNLSLQALGSKEKMRALVGVVGSGAYTEMQV